MLRKIRARWSALRWRSQNREDQLALVTRNGPPTHIRQNEIANQSLSDPRPFIFKGTVVLVITFGGFGTWAAVAPLDSGVIAPGTVIVDGQRKKIQHQEGGVVDALLVREGDRVKAGQVLLELDSTRARASESILQGAYDVARAEEARLIAEIEGSTILELPVELASRADDPKISKILDGQRKLFKARQTALAGQTNILRTQIDQSKKEIAGLQAEMGANDEQMRILTHQSISKSTFLSILQLRICMIGYEARWTQV